MSEKLISTVKWDRGWWQNKKGVMIRWHILNIVYKLLSIFAIWEQGSSAEMPLPDLLPVILPRQGSPVPQSCHLSPSSSPLCLSLRQEWNHIHLAQPKAGSENPGSPHELSSPGLLWEGPALHLMKGSPWQNETICSIIPRSSGFYRQHLKVIL